MLKAIDGAPAPVLWSVDFGEIGAAGFNKGAVWWSWSGPLDDSAVTVTVTGSAATRLYPGIEPHRGGRAIRGGSGFVSRNEGVQVVTWIEHGAAYSLEVECGRPDDTACASPRYAVQLTESMVFVGGASS